MVIAAIGEAAPFGGPRLLVIAAIGEAAPFGGPHLLVIAANGEGVAVGEMTLTDNEKDSRHF